MTLEGVDIFLCHEPFRAAALSPLPDVIIHGHTHQARREIIDGTLWFNPGSASKARSGRDVLSVGLLVLEQGKVEARIVPLRE